MTQRRSPWFLLPDEATLQNTLHPRCDFLCTLTLTLLSIKLFTVSVVEEVLFYTNFEIFRYFFTRSLTL
jgi:hypothetical protein